MSYIKYEDLLTKANARKEALLDLEELLDEVCDAIEGYTTYTAALNRVVIKFETQTVDSGLDTEAFNMLPKDIAVSLSRLLGSYEGSLKAATKIFTTVNEFNEALLRTKS